MNMEESYDTLNDMMESFEGCFLIEKTDIQEDIDVYKEQFTRAKLCLELGCR